MRLLVSIFILLFAFSAHSQSLDKYSKVVIDIKNKDQRKLRFTGIDACSGTLIPQRSITGIYNQEELSKIKAVGFEYEVLVDDIVQYYQANGTMDDPLAIVQRDTPCETIDSGYDFDTPVNYTDGSMGGYLTYNEALAELAKMSSLYPNLINTAQQIGPLTHDNNPILWFRISDNPDQDEMGEPEILLTSLHHAREPNSLSQLIFYMWYLLENYDSDEEIKYLVDNTQQYFIPIVNPDGYIFNESMLPNGGGLWRKNRFANANGSVVGVDLNRNYGYFWGFDDTGSSPDEDNQTYRGPGPFSEPETQAIRALSIQQEFQIVLNYHTYGDLFIHPWGYNDQPTSEDVLFKSMANFMTDDNNYLVGTGTETVGYVVNGDADDYQYGEVVEKIKSYAYTPEVGPSFWPGSVEIDQLNKSTMRMNLNAAHLLLNYGEAEELFEEALIQDLTGSLQFKVTKYGFKSGPLDFSVISKTPGLSFTNNINTGINLTSGTSMDFNISYTIDENLVANEDLLDIELIVDNGLYQHSINIIKTYRNNTASEVIALGSQVDLNGYTFSGDWGITDEDFVSSPNSISDSPNASYANNMDSEIALNEPIDLTTAIKANLKFFTKWNIEANFDYVQVLASTDQIDYTPLCGKYTEAAVDDQIIDGSPVYDGIQEEWVMESMCLDDYVGEEVYIKFKFHSDGFVNPDGFYFDDLSVEIINEVSSVDEPIALHVELSPNPFNEQLSLTIDTKRASDLELRVLDVRGVVVYSEKLTGTRASIFTGSWPNGSYLLSIFEGNKRLTTRKIIKQN